MCDITTKITNYVPKYIYKLVIKELIGYRTIFAGAIIGENTELNINPIDTWYDKEHPLSKYNLISGFASIKGAKALSNSRYKSSIYTMLKIKEGVPVVDALWLGASVKFRVIIMTSLAIVLGVLPQLSSVMPIKSSMGTVMIGGMLASIFFTFVFTPVMFWYVYRLRSVFVRDNK